MRLPTPGRRWYLFWQGWNVGFGLLNAALAARSVAAEDWGSAAVGAAAAVLMFGLFFLQRWSRRRHEARMAALDDEFGDLRSRLLNRYYSLALTDGEYVAYRVIERFCDDDTLRDLGIYKTPAELAELHRNLPPY